ncbi:MAG: hypothetical protein Q9M89_08950 [Persephonella sp.]|nr:hypothetical protein [Persephonella sp.]
MEASFYRKDFVFYGYRLKEISGNVLLSGGKVKTVITGKGLEDFDKMKLSIHSLFEL